MSDVGELSLWVSLAFAVWTAAGAATGAAFHRPELLQSARRGLVAAGLATFTAIAILAIALWQRDFSVRYVAATVSQNLPTVWAIAALWSARAGAVLLLATCVAGIGLISQRDPGLRHPALLAVPGAVLAALAAFGIALHPFARLEWSTVDGLGLEPVLQHPSMFIHPPAMALSAALTVPLFGLVIGAAIGRSWSKTVAIVARRWAVIAWAVTTIAILTGMWWAYRAAVSSGWLADPFAHGAVIPWLLLSLGCAGAAIEARRGGRIRSWWLAVLGSSFLAAVPLALITWNGVSSGWWLAFRSVGGWVLALTALAAAMFLFVTVGRAVPPVEGVETSKSRTRWGGWLLFGGLVLFGIAAAGTAFDRSHDAQLRPGEGLTVGDPFGREWRFVSQGLSRYDARGRRITVIPLQSFESGAAAGLLASERWFQLDRHGDSHFDPAIVPAVRHRLLQDVRVRLTGLEGDVGTFRIEFLPFMWLAWVGGLLVLAGGSIAWWPSPERAA